MVSHTVWKTWPSGLSSDKNLGLRPRFVSTESLGPCFSHGMGDHDQILQYVMNYVKLCDMLTTYIRIFHCRHFISFLFYSWIQSSAVIKRFNIVRCYINNCRNWGRISIKCWIHIRDPILRPNGWAMGCLPLIYIFLENWPRYNGAALYFAKDVDI